MEASLVISSVEVFLSNSVQSISTAMGENDVLPKSKVPHSDSSEEETGSSDEEQSGRGSSSGSGSDRSTDTTKPSRQPVCFTSFFCSSFYFTGCCLDFIVGILLSWLL